MSETRAYEVLGMHCEHCVGAVEEEVGAVPGVDDVEASLETKLLTVGGTGLSDGAIRAAFEEAGYEAAR